MTSIAAQIETVDVGIEREKHSSPEPIMDGEETIKMAHINLGNARAATCQLAQDATSQHYICISVNEPCFNDNTLIDIPAEFIIIASRNKPRAALLLLKTLDVTTLHLDRDIVAAQIKFMEHTFNIFSSYCSPNEDINPNLQKLTDLLNLYKGETTYIMGDFNAKSSLWGDRPLDHSGSGTLLYIYWDY